MTSGDLQLIAAALLGIGASIALILRGRMHPFLALLCGAFIVGLCAGLSANATAAAVEKGAGDILGNTGLIVALGLSLGAMLQLSGGANALARAGIGMTGPAGAPWASLAVALIVGLPLFFETGLVLLLPIVAAAAASMTGERGSDYARLRLVLPALAGLSVIHALVPPHPGPLIAVNALGANLGRTIVYGLIVAIPTAVIAGPVLSRFIARGITLAPPVIETHALVGRAPRNGVSLAIVLMPVVLIAGGQIQALMPADIAPRFGWLATLSNPVLALLITNLAALAMLFGRRLSDAAIQESIWDDTLKPAGAILLAIGAGGALKQVLVTAGLSDLLGRIAAESGFSPILLAWLVAVAIRLATGSATVATITTAGIMTGVLKMTGASPEWMVLAIGAGSVFFSHVNDPGFWLVKSYVGTSTADTFKTWSVLETVVSVVGLICVLVASGLF
ncbi:MAG: GntT/GntP/DsdX family permease [Sphingomonas sp.]